MKNFRILYILRFFTKIIFIVGEFMKKIFLFLSFLFFSQPVFAKSSNDVIEVLKFLGIIIGMPAIILFITDYLKRGETCSFQEEIIKKHEKTISQYREKEESIKKKEKDLSVLESKKKSLIEASDMFAEYFSNTATSLFEDLRKSLIYKRRPADSSAKKVAECQKKTKEELKKYKKYQYIVETYERLFPWLVDFKEIPLEDTFAKKETNQQDEDEYVFSKYLSETEKNTLSKSEKFQRSLDRYTESFDKSNWQIGLFYERYIGYLYETALGYKVIMNGAKERWQDMGIDLIATKQDKTALIQCKYWSKDKTIYEKYIFQLFGTTINYICENYPEVKDPVDLIRKGIVNPVFITSTELSNTARRVAKALGIELKEKYSLDREYPKIKCNPNSATGERIYHLPFDQQYDNFQVSQTEGAFYAKTIAEAEKKGFRRAYKWCIKQDSAT